MIRFTALLLLTMTSVVHAADKNFSIFAGGGISTGKSTISGVATSAASSKFTTQGYFLEGGMNVPVSGDFGWSLGGELGRSLLTNNLKSETYLETGDLEFYALKLGLYLRQFSFGIGYRHHDLSIKSVSLDSDSYLENSYSGFAPFAFGGFSVEFRQRYRAAIEGQYISTKLQNSTGTSVNYGEMNVGLRVFLMFE